MTTYLQLNNGHTGDYLKFPSLTITKIIASITVRRHTDTTRGIWDFRPGIGFSFLQQTTSGVDSWGTGTVKVNGTTVSNSTAAIPNGVKCTLEHDVSGTGVGFVGSLNSLTAFGDMDVYDIQVFNGATLVAHYDMSTGSVTDQSGNGNNATLTGGSWLNDGSGQTTTYVGGGSITSSASLTSASHIVLADGRSINGNSSLTAGERFYYAANGSLSGQSNLSSIEYMLYLASGTLQSVSSLGSSDAYIGASGTRYSGMGNIISLSSLSSGEIEKYIGLGGISSFASLTGNSGIIIREKGDIQGVSIPGNTIVNTFFNAHGNILVNAFLSSGDLLNGMKNPQQYQDTGIILMHTGLLSHEELIHFAFPLYHGEEIHINGIRKLNLYIIGKQENTIYLKGVRK